MTKTKALVKFDFDVAVITALDAKYKDIQITDGKSYAIVMAGLAEYRGLRLRIDDMHKNLKKDILEAGRALDGDKNRLKCLLEPGEDYLQHIRLTWDEDKAAIKAEKEAKEAERVKVIQDKIISIHDLGVMYGKNSLAIKERLTLVTGIEISTDIYQEFTAPAIECQKVTVDELERALADRLQFEKEEIERQAESKRLEAQRKEQEAAQAKIDEETRKIEEEKAKIEVAKEAEKLHKGREEFERQATLRAEEEVKKKGAREEQAKIEKEEAEAKEKERKAAMAPDKEKLTKWVQSFNETNNPTPQLKSKKAKEILGLAKETIESVLQAAEDEIEKL